MKISVSGPLFAPFTLELNSVNVLIPRDQPLKKNPLIIEANQRSNDDVQNPDKHAV